MTLNGKSNVSADDPSKYRKTIMIKNKMERIKWSERREMPLVIVKALDCHQSMIGTILDDPHAKELTNEDFRKL